MWRTEEEKEATWLLMKEIPKQNILLSSSACFPSDKMPSGQDLVSQIRNQYNLEHSTKELLTRWRKKNKKNNLNIFSSSINKRSDYYWELSGEQVQQMNINRRSVCNNRETKTVHRKRQEQMKEQVLIKTEIAKEQNHNENKKVNI